MPTELQKFILDLNLDAAITNKTPMPAMVPMDNPRRTLDGFGSDPACPEVSSPNIRLLAEASVDPLITQVLVRNYWEKVDAVQKEKMWLIQRAVREHEVAERKRREELKEKEELLRRARVEKRKAVPEDEGRAGPSKVSGIVFSFLTVANMHIAS